MKGREYGPRRDFFLGLLEGERRSKGARSVFLDFSPELICFHTRLSVDGLGFIQIFDGSPQTVLGTIDGASAGFFFPPGCQFFVGMQLIGTGLGKLFLALVAGSHRGFVFVPAGAVCNIGENVALHQQFLQGLRAALFHGGEGEAGFSNCELAQDEIICVARRGFVVFLRTGEHLGEETF